MVDTYESTVRPFAMYRDVETMQEWPDRAEILGTWEPAYTGAIANPDGKLEAAADFSEPRVQGHATRRRKQPDH